MDLYEQVFYELIEIREMYAANAMLMNCDPLVRMKTERTEKYIHLLNFTCRYMKMEYWLKKSYFDPVEVYAAGETKESRRQKLASLISSYVSKLFLYSLC